MQAFLEKKSKNARIFCNSRENRGKTAAGRRKTASGSRNETGNQSSSL